MRYGYLVLIVFALGACASAPKLDTARVDSRVTPATAVQGIDAVRGQRVLWGGMILSGKNYENYTELEVLGYPLGEDQKPQVERQPSGRFIARVAGYLELAEYDPGSRVTVVGPILDLRRGTLGESEYTYAVIEAEQRQLWPDEAPARGDSNTRFHFGIGVIFR